MLKDTPSVNKPRFIMAKIEVNSQDVREEIKALKLYRSGWANDIREGWNVGMPEAKEVLFGLYEISGSIILALQDVEAGCYRDKVAMLLVREKLERLVKSESFDYLSAMADEGFCRIVGTGTRHHIRVMFQALDVLTA